MKAVQKPKYKTVTKPRVLNGLENNAQIKTVEINKFNPTVPTK